MASRTKKKYQIYPDDRFDTELRQAQLTVLGRLLSCPDDMSIALQSGCDEDLFPDPVIKMMFAAMRDGYTTSTEWTEMDILRIASCSDISDSITARDIIREAREYDAREPNITKAVAALRSVSARYRIRQRMTGYHELVAGTPDSQMSCSINEFCSDILSCWSQDRVSITDEDMRDRIDLYQSGQLKPVAHFIREMASYPIYTPCLLVIGARPSTGKSSLALYLAEQFEKNVYLSQYFSFEMSEEALYLRRIAMRTCIPVNTIRTHHALDRSQLIAVSDAISDIKRSNNHMIYRRKTISQIVADIRNRHSHGYRVAIIDHLGIMAGLDHSSMNASISRVTSALAELSRELNMLIVVLSQLNRQVSQRQFRDTTDTHTKLPTASDLRDSGSIEQDADVIWLLHREDMYRPLPHDDSTTVRVVIAKNREDKIGQVDLRVNFSYGIWGCHGLLEKGLQA